MSWQQQTEDLLEQLSEFDKTLSTIADHFSKVKMELEYFDNCKFGTPGLPVKEGAAASKILDKLHKDLSDLREDLDDRLEAHIEH